MVSRLPTVWVLTLLAALGGALPCMAQDAPKKLLEYGWDVPYPDYVRANIATIRAQPFDGLIFRLATYHFAFDPKPWAREDLQPQLDDLAATEWGTLSDNFLTLYSANDVGMDWFNDDQWAVIEGNLGLTSLAVATGGCVGVCFDPEPYGANPWLYSQADERPFGEVALQVRRRGAQFMRGLRLHTPDLKMLVLFHATFMAGVLEAATPELAEQSLRQHPYALYPAFFNGMLDACDGGARIIDGNEMAYYYTTPEAFIEARDLIRGPAKALIAPENHGKYDDYVDVGMSVYMDQVMGTRPPEGGFVSDYMTPDAQLRRMEHNVHWAMTASDEYTWFYSERMNWWTGEIPEGMADAVLAAKAKVASGQELGFSIQDDILVARSAMQEALAPRLQAKEARLSPLPGDVRPPDIDGDIGDPQWAQVGPLEPFVPTASNVGRDTPEARTEAWVTYDSANLYIALRCDEPDLARLVLAGASRDDTVWMGDSVDFFLGLSDAREPYAHLIVNPAGLQWDALTDTLDNDTTWNAEWLSGVHQGDGFWSVEMAVPWAALGGPPAPGETRFANLCRNRQPTPELSSWSPVAQGFVEPENFGRWSFGEAER